MRSNQRARLVALASTAAGLLALAACGPDPRIKQLTTGIDRDSVLKVIGQDGAAGEQMPNVYSTEQYLSKGEMLEILYFSPEGKKVNRDSVELREDLTPVVLVNEKLGGHGWDYYDSVAVAHNINGAATNAKQQD
jgi:hypothetical protein